MWLFVLLAIVFGTISSSTITRSFLFLSAFLVLLDSPVHCTADAVHYRTTCYVKTNVFTIQHFVVTVSSLSCQIMFTIVIAALPNCVRIFPNLSLQFWNQALDHDVFRLCPRLVKHFSVDIIETFSGFCVVRWVGAHLL